MGIDAHPLNRLITVNPLPWAGFSISASGQARKSYRWVLFAPRSRAFIALVLHQQPFAGGKERVGSMRQLGRPQPWRAPYCSSTSRISGKGANSSAEHFTSPVPEVVSIRQLQSRRLADPEPDAA